MIPTVHVQLINGDPCPSCGTPVQKRAGGIWCRTCKGIFEERKNTTKDARLGDYVAHAQVESAKPFMRYVVSHDSRPLPTQENVLKEYKITWRKGTKVNTEYVWAHSWKYAKDIEDKEQAAGYPKGAVVFYDSGRLCHTAYNVVSVEEIRSLKDE